MAYTQRNFSDGSILYASDLNAMDDQIALNEQIASRIADSENAGRVKVLGGWTGILINDEGALTVLGASPTDLINKTEWSKPIVAANYVDAVRLAISEAASTTNPAYSDSEKIGACKRLGVLPNRLRKLHTETADGTKSFIRFTADDDGNPFEVEELVMYATIPATSYTVRFTLWLQNEAGAWKTTRASTTGAMQGTNATKYTETRWYNRTGDRWQCESVSSGSIEVGSYAYRSAGDASSEVGTVTSIKAVLMYIYGTDVKIPSGTVLEFWGR